LHRILSKLLVVIKITLAFDLIRIVILRTYII